MMNSKTVTVSIHCSPKKVYDFVSNAENLPKWAKTFCKSVRKSDGEWLIETPEGPVKIRFVPKNNFGILDHYVSPSWGEEILVPMRVVPNGSGCELIFTLFQPPGMSDAQYVKDNALVEQDLESLKHILENS